MKPTTEANCPVPACPFGSAQGLSLSNGSPARISASRSLALRALIRNTEARIENYALMLDVLECDQIPRDFHEHCVEARQRLAALQAELAHASREATQGAAALNSFRPAGVNLLQPVS